MQCYTLGQNHMSVLDSPTGEHLSAVKTDKDIFDFSTIYETTLARSFSPALDGAPVLDASFLKTFVNQLKTSAWKQPSSCATTNWKQVIIVVGPCGSGKSTVKNTSV